MSVMRRSRKRTWVVLAVFLGVLVIGGVALAATDNMANPLPFLETRSEGPPRGGEERVAPPDMAENGERPQRGEHGGRGAGGGHGHGADLTQAGDVLFNLWFVGVVSAVVMGISTPLASLRRRRRSQQGAATRAPA